MENTVWVLKVCNEWKEHSSSSIIGVFNDEDILKSHICNMFKEGEIEWRGSSISAIKEKILEDFEDIDDNELSEEESEKEIIEQLEASIEEILSDINSYSVDAINSYATYIMLESYELNEIY